MQWVAVKLPIVFCVKSETFFIQKVLLYLSAQTVNLMEDFGDYFYLIVIAIAALSSLFKKKKPTAATVPHDEPIDIEEQLRELFEEKKVQPQPEIVKPVEKPKENSFSNYKSYETTTDTASLRAHKQVTKIPKTPVQMQEEVPAMLTVELDTVEQARKAFIYSEIFNRKY